MSENEWYIPPEISNDPMAGSLVNFRPHRPLGHTARPPEIPCRIKVERELGHNKSFVGMHWVYGDRADYERRYSGAFNDMYTKQITMTSGHPRAVLQVRKNADFGLLGAEIRRQIDLPVVDLKLAPDRLPVLVNRLGRQVECLGDLLR
jgi:hypothetical protein